MDFQSPHFFFSTHNTEAELGGWVAGSLFLSFIAIKFKSHGQSTHYKPKHIYLICGLKPIIIVIIHCLHSLTHTCVFQTKTNVKWRAKRMAQMEKKKHCCSPIKDQTIRIQTYRNDRFSYTMYGTEKAMTRNVQT